MSKNIFSAKRITNIALLTTIALTIFMIEAQIPPLVAIHGIKLGLANIITVFAMFLLGPRDTFYILICRIILGSIFSGQMMSFLYSLIGGLFCYTLMLLLHKLLSRKQIWICSVFGAIAHNVGQICVAIVVTGTPMILSYLPILLFSGIIAGTITGIAAQMLVNHIEKLGIF